jgi:hypothetical protein
MRRAQTVAGRRRIIGTCSSGDGVIREKRKANNSKDPGHPEKLFGEARKIPLFLKT